VNVRALGRYALSTALMAAGLIAVTPGSAHACGISGTYSIHTGPNIAAVMQYQLIAIGYTPGCLSGAVLVQAVPLVGAPASCTLPIPSTYGTTSCSSLGGITGVTTSTPVLLTAQLVGIGTGGPAGQAVRSCTVHVAPSGSYSCSF
jgi:hypothetical protein